MSYPDLGCFAECLECDLCEDDKDDIDLFDIPDDFFDDGTPDWLDPDWGPPPDPDDGLDFDFDLPPVRPTWDPWGLEWTGEF